MPPVLHSPVLRTGFRLTDGKHSTAGNADACIKRTLVTSPAPGSQHGEDSTVCLDGCAVMCVGVFADMYAGMCADMPARMSAHMCCVQTWQHIMAEKAASLVLTGGYFLATFRGMPTANAEG